MYEDHGDRGGIWRMTWEEDFISENDEIRLCGDDGRPLGVIDKLEGSPRWRIRRMRDGKLSSIGFSENKASAMFALTEAVRMTS